MSNLENLHADKTIDLTPTWSSVLPALIAILADGNWQSKEFARKELLKLVGIADNVQSLVNAAQSVVDSWETSSLAEAVNYLDGVLEDFREDPPKI